nr:hypothetical transcript [Hymenolepis microstoma]
MVNSHCRVIVPKQYLIIKFYVKAPHGAHGQDKRVPRHISVSFNIIEHLNIVTLRLDFSLKRIFKDAKLLVNWFFSK